MLNRFMPRGPAARRVPFVAASVVVALVFLRLEVAPAPGQTSRAQWGAPNEFGTPPKRIGAFDVDVGRGPAAIVAWARGARRDDPESTRRASGRGQVEAAFRTRGEAFGPPLRVDRNGAQEVSVATSKNTRSAVMWQASRGRLFIRIMSRGGSLAPRQLLDRRVLATSELEMTPKGSILAAWTARTNDRPTVLRAAEARPDERLLRTRAISRGRAFGPFPPAVAASSAGRGVVLWGGTCNGVQGSKNAKASFSPAGRFTFTTPVAVPRSRCPDSGLDVALSGEGRAIALLSGSRRRLGGIRVSGGRASGFGPTTFISAPTEEADFGAVEATGLDRAVVVWNRYEDGDSKAVVSVTLEKGQPIGGTKVLSAQDRPSRLNLESAADGTAVVTWESLSTFRIMAAVACPGTQFGHPETMSDRLPNRAIARSKAVVNGAGRGVGVWSRPTPTEDVGPFSSTRHGPRCIN